MYISIGKIVKTHGVAGAIKAIAYTGDPERFLSLKTVYFQLKDGIQGFIIEEATILGDATLLKLKGIDNREAARNMVRQEVLVPESEQVDLPDDMFFVHDLLGLKVFDNNSVFLGVLEDVLSGAGSDIYVIRHDEQELLLPAVSEFIREIDLEERRMVVELIDGMLDAN